MTFKERTPEEREKAKNRKKEERIKINKEISKMGIDDKKKELTTIVDAILDTAEEANDEWHRYVEEGIKVGARKARRALLTVKKQTMVFRRIMKTVDLRGDIK
jgi:hypothetical protein